MDSIVTTEPIDKVKESDESDTEILKPKVKKPCSDVKREQLKLARLKRTEKKDKQLELDRIEAAKYLVAKGVKIPKKKPEPEPELKTDSESEEEIIVKKKKTESKTKKDKKKKRVVIEYSDSDSDSSVPPSPPPTPPQKERKLVSQQNKKSLIKVSLPVPKIVNYFAD